MVETKSLIWDETFPSLLLKGEGTSAFLHGQTTADIFSQTQLERIFLSCWLSTKGTLKAPSKKVGNPRRASFCARMRGMKKKLTSKKTANDPQSRINKSLRAWNC